MTNIYDKTGTLQILAAICMRMCSESQEWAQSSLVFSDRRQDLDHNTSLHPRSHVDGGLRQGLSVLKEKSKRKARALSSNCLPRSLALSTVSLENLVYVDLIP